MLMPASTFSASAAASGSAGVDGCSTSTSSDTPGLGITPQQKDTTWTKLFVGGLPYHTTDKSLRDHFKIYGEIEEAVVITDRQTGKSRGYGFVIMSERIAAERACKEPNPIIDGRKANVNLAILGAKPRGNAATVPDPFQSYPLVYSQRAASTLNQHPAFPFTAIRTGYPTQLLASQYGLPGSYVYPAYGGTPLLSLPTAAANPSAIAALAAQASQLYDSYQQPNNLVSSGVGQPTTNSYPAAHFAAAQAAFADPYASYLAQGHNNAQHHAAAAYAAAYMPAGSTSVAAAAAAAQALSSQAYASVAQDSRMQ